MQVPIVVVSGFFGAGKTSLLKRFLLNPEGLRLALVKNEFTDVADISFEEPLLVNEDDTAAFEQYLELPNSCVCCSAKSQFEQAIARLVQKGVEESKPFDLVLLEISGIADPCSLAERMLNATDLEEDLLRFAGIISLVDASTLGNEQLLEEAVIKERAGDPNHSASLKDLFTKQIACADLIVLNKCDLISRDQVGDFQKNLSSINPSADIIQCIQSNVPMSTIRGLMDRERVARELALHSQPIHSHLGAVSFIEPVETHVLIYEADLIFEKIMLEELLERFLWSLEGMQEKRVFRQVESV